MASDAIEQATQTIGRQIFARIDRHGPSVFERHWWEERILEWAMSDPHFKVQMFRFIDVLPALKTPRQISHHLEEYFADLDDLLPAVLRRGVKYVDRSPLASRAVAIGARKNADLMARRFIAGATPADAVAAARRLRRDRMGFSLDILGEAVTSENAAAAEERAYLGLLDALADAAGRWEPLEQVDVSPLGPLPRVNISVKLSSLYENFDPIDPEGTASAAKERLRRILQRAREAGAFIHMDMEQYEHKDLTLRVFRDILLEDEFRDWEDVGIALQAYLRDCERDVHELAEWAKSRGHPVWVRLVKGAYWDYETIIARQRRWPVPVFTRKPETDASFETLSEFLLANHELLRPAFGSHNVRSLAHAIAVSRSLGLPDRLPEFQLLYGMGDRIKHALVDLGLRVRVYTPCGELIPGMAYLVRRLLENTANESFLRLSFTEKHSVQELLAAPVVKEAAPRADARHAEGGGGFANEPLSDFAREESRHRMREALAEISGRLGARYPLVIGGERIVTDSTIPSVNPAHKSEVVGIAASAGAAEAEAAVAAAKEALAGWRDTRPADRARYLFRAAEVMRRRRFELAAGQVYECGKQWREADADVAEATDYLEYYGREMMRLRGQRRDVPGEENAYVYRPRGVAVVIAPWNFPLAILTGMTTAALVTGNTVIMKPAEQSPVVAAGLMEVVAEVGLPPGVLNYLPGVGEEVGPVLVSHPDVALIAFTGSRAVGTMINELAAQRREGQRFIKRVIAEMGGKNAIIVDADADLDEAVSGVLVSAFGYAGQKCSACSRVIVVSGIYDAFVRRLVDSAESLKVGPPIEPGNQVGPLIDEEAQRRVLGRIETARTEGAILAKRDVSHLADEGFYVPPTIVGDIPPDASTCQEEIFGPVLAVLRAASFAEAISVANGTAYALTGGLYSRSPRHIRQARAQFQVGNLYINRKITGAEVDRQPFGGFRMSGIGSKAGGPDYLLQFLIPRTITENTIRRGFAPESRE
jgi:RHH-type proline utilization regulon transcriptional repressor/proline dehydrogenase/delta 1-pyrroline-5-carboxylate dehydrogenase